MKGIKQLRRKLEPHLHIPAYKGKRIFGTENEYGVVNPEWGSLPSDEFISNGGRVYPDCKHIEYASPETSNPLEAVVYEKAGELICLPFAKKLYKNNIDSRGNSFGAHENYSTKIKPKNLEEIMPFLITRQIFAGAGKLNKDGIFEISQKSGYIQKVFGTDTRYDRGIITDTYDLGNNLRLHLILGDANMCEIADFLKLGTTGLILDLAEDKKLPVIEYNLEKAVEDLQSISRTKEWILQGTQKETKATEMQRAYIKSAMIYKGRDQVTNQILAWWNYTIENLDRNPMK